MPSDSGSAWSPPAGSGERRLSNSSDGSAGSGYSKAVSTDSGEYVRTRTTVAAGARPPVNPLKFVKVGPCDLYRSAQEQLKRAEEVKKSKEVKKEEQEDWQSNLDNWKSSRRKRVEHIIERCVEVKKMENEPVPGARAKNKTFNEMLEERAGKRRRCPLNLYTEEEATDLSDLGIGTSSTKSSLSEDCDTHSLTSDGLEGDKNNSDVDTISNCDNTSRKQVLSSNEYDTCTTTTISSPEPEEYTYEGAIEGYKSRIISQTNIINTQYKSYGNNKYEEPELTTEKTPKSDINFIRATVSNTIETKVTSFQQTRQNSVTEITKSRKDLPKVDILKRRELFEKENSPETFSLSKNRSSTDLANPKSIKERLSNLEKHNEENHQKSMKDLNKIPVEVASIKDRLTSLEKVKSSGIEVDKSKRLSNSDLANTRSIKERLSSFKSQASEDESKLVKTEVKNVSQSLKERLSNLDAARNKEIVRQTSDIDFHIRTDKEDNITQREDKKDEFINSSNRSSISGLELQMQNFCRSLDSLDINDSSMHSPFERVQSLEDFDSCREPLNNTTPSDIETEDSGVHTAHGSCAVSQVDETAESVDLQTVEILAEEQETRDISEPELSNDDMCSKLPQSPLPPVGLQYDSHVDTDDDKIDESDDTSSKEFHQALSQVDDEISVTEDTTEINLDKEDEDTVKSLDNHDTSVSLHENNSASSDGENVVFEGKMLIHLNLNEICNNQNAGVGIASTNDGNSTNSLAGKNHSTNTNMNSNYSTVTVSNIFTTTNLSPKGSIASLKSSNDSINIAANSSATDIPTSPIHKCYESIISPNSTIKIIDLSRQSREETPNSPTLSITSNDSSSNLPSSQDSNPFWQKRHRSSLEPNRRHTILHIRNKSIAPKSTEDLSCIPDMPEIIPITLRRD